MGASNKGPKNVTIYGRLSFPQWTAQEAFDRSQGGQYPAKSVAEAQPNFQLLLEQGMLDKIRDHILNVFFPYCIEQEKNDERRDKLSAAEVKELSKQLKDPNFEGVYNVPLKPVHEKTKPLAPECVAAVKCIGNKGVDLDLKAIVQGEDELAVPDPEILKFPVVKPINETNHQMYPGCYVAVTINLYAYHNGKLPGFSAGVSTAVFRADGDRFGGGVAVDEDEIFMD